MKSKQEMKQYALAILAAVQSSGPQGIPSGHIYANVMSAMSLEEYNEILEILKEIGVIRERGFVLTYAGPAPAPVIHSMTCEDCGLVEGVDDTFCPYDQEINGTHSPVRLCGPCYQKRANDI